MGRLRRLRATARFVCLTSAAWLALVTTVAVAAAETESPTYAVRTRALELAYNLDLDEPVAIMQRAAKEHPNDAATFRTLATLAWLRILFARGSITADDYLGPVTKQTIAMPQPPADLAQLFTANVQRATAISERRLTANPKDVDALYELGATIGLSASYSASVEGRMFAAFQAARRAYNTHERVLTLDPRRKDAGLVVGTYRYLVAGLAMPLRWVAYLAGFGGGRQRGLRMIEEAAAFDSDARIEAKFALVLLYNRERRYDAALEVLDELQRLFPRNRLLWLEAGATALRAGRAAQAERQLAAGLARLSTDSRPRMAGEEMLWRYKYGSALAALGRRDQARGELQRALAAPGRSWIRGRTHTELGRLAAASGDRAAAVREFDRAVALCESDNDPMGATEARRLKAALPQR